MKKMDKKTKSFDFYSDIYIPLIVSVAEDAETLNKNYEFCSPGSDMNEVRSESLMDEVSGFTARVRDKEDEMLYKILVWFPNLEAMTVRHITHEAFHATMFICYHHGMDIGMKIGQDEHAAYIAGWVANSCSLVYNELTNTKSNGKKKYS